MYNKGYSRNFIFYIKEDNMRRVAIIVILELLVIVASWGQELIAEHYEQDTQTLCVIVAQNIPWNSKSIYAYQIVFERQFGEKVATLNEYCTSIFWKTYNKASLSIGRAYIATIIYGDREYKILFGKTSNDNVEWIIYRFWR